MTLSKNCRAGQLIPLKEFDLNKMFTENEIDSEAEMKPLLVPLTKDLSSVGEFYNNSIQLEDTMHHPSSLNTFNYTLLPFYSDLIELDETASHFNSVQPLLTKLGTSPFGISTLGLNPRSYLSVFNSFRSDFGDFT
jgi:hypothetical protein